MRDNKKREPVEYQPLARGLKNKQKTMKHEGDGDTNSNLCTRHNTPKGL